MASGKSGPRVRIHIVGPPKAFKTTIAALIRLMLKVPAADVHDDGPRPAGDLVERAEALGFRGPAISIEVSTERKQPWKREPGLDDLRGAPAIRDRPAPKKGRRGIARSRPRS